MSVSFFLLAVAGVFLIGAIGEAVFRHTNVPDVVWLIVVGIVLGPIAGVVKQEYLQGIAPYFAAITLIVILFEGGSRLQLGELSRSAPRSALLAALTFVPSMLVIAALSMGAAAVGWLPGPWSWQHGLLIGAILGGSSSIVIMPAMARARVEPALANLLGLESAFTDVLCVVGASTMMDLMLHGAGAGSPLAALGRTFGIGLAIGAGAGVVWFLLLGRLRDSEHAYPITLAGLLVLYVVIERAGGSAALGILAFAVILGNAHLIGTHAGLSGTLEIGRDVRGYHAQIVFIIKSFFFTFIGAMLGPPWSLVVLGVLLGGALLAARIPGVFLATLGRDAAAHRGIAYISMPRGLAAGVLATLPAAVGVPGTTDLPAVVFPCVFATILIFAVGFPLARRRAAGAEGAGAVIGTAAPATPAVPAPAVIEPAPRPAAPAAPTEEGS